jgi:hypothetical protein
MDAQHLTGSLALGTVSTGAELGRLNCVWAHL